MAQHAPMNTSILHRKVNSVKYYHTYNTYSISVHRNFLYQFTYASTATFSCQL